MAEKQKLVNIVFQLNGKEHNSRVTKSIFDFLQTCSDPALQGDILHQILRQPAGQKIVSEEQVNQQPLDLPNTPSTSGVSQPSQPSTSKGKISSASGNQVSQPSTSKGKISSASGNQVSQPSTSQGKISSASGNQVSQPSTSQGKISSASGNQVSQASTSKGKISSASGNQVSQPSTSQGKFSSASQQPPKIWQEEEEKALVAARVSKDKEFCAGVKDHQQLWKRIQSELADLEIEATLTQIVNKWNQLKKRYKEVKDHNRKTGNDPKYFKFSSQFDMLYGEKSSTIPVVTLDSLSDASSKSKVNDSKAKTRTENVEVPSRKRPRHLEIMEEMLSLTHSMAEEAKKTRDAKMERMDRFLDIFSKSLGKSNTEE